MNSQFFTDKWNLKFHSVALNFLPFCYSWCLKLCTIICSSGWLGQGAFFHFIFVDDKDFRFHFSCCLTFSSCRFLFHCNNTCINVIFLQLEWIPCLSFRPYLMTLLFFCSFESALSSVFSPFDIGFQVHIGNCGECFDMFIQFLLEDFSFVLLFIYL